jgi:hypothetical protein
MEEDFQRKSKKYREKYLDGFDKLYGDFEDEESYGTYPEGRSRTDIIRDLAEKKRNPGSG